METLIVVVHVLAALGVTGLVLIQHGKGADMGASFGSGASQTIFGSVGSGNALTKSTTWLATVFFITSLVLALFANQQAGQNIQDSLLIENPEQLDTGIPQETDTTVPADPVTSDLPAAPAAESQADEIPAAPQNQDAAVEVPVTEEPAASATEESVEEAPEDLQNATEN
jgi:preprotein translocase subunit SecG